MITMIKWHPILLGGIDPELEALDIMSGHQYRLVQTAEVLVACIWGPLDRYHDAMRTPRVIFLLGNGTKAKSPRGYL